MKVIFWILVVILVVILFKKQIIMGRFVNDFSQLYSSMGGVTALRLILLPRVCARLHSDWYSFDNEVNRLIQRKFGYIADK